jgi:hypothetical protein
MTTNVLHQIRSSGLPTTDDDFLYDFLCFLNFLEFSAYYMAWPQLCAAAATALPCAFYKSRTKTIMTTNVLHQIRSSGLLTTDNASLYDFL